ncbi:1-acyl-sn-glycerol-3-phosphate acyltransferase [Reichenbachiella sp. MALMAid0571]|uniref:1-acyl-sn-glycerol-3-phosphate acyltransferase n=1 Tax=Reichenbachiella sp. MALMAid0571 TaxID=3143939 RepID=UPI0032DEE08E
MIYNALKQIVKLALWIFFSKIIVNKKRELPDKGPLIIVVNHPNTFMDPLIVAALFRQQVGFLGNASIFVNKIVNAVFRYFNVIPVYRQKDVESNEPIDNENAFRACTEYLTNGNTLMIFPEGSSYHELKLRKIKTGTARIALTTEEQNDFKLGLKILPVGLYYSNPSRFRSKIHINVDQVFEVSEFQDIYEQDKIKGVQELTERIRKVLAENVITTEDDEQEELFIKLKRVYKSRLLSKTNFSQEFQLTKEMIKAIEYFKISNEVSFARIKSNVDRYIRILEEEGLSGSGQNMAHSMPKKILYTLLGFIYLIIGFPVYLSGVIQNYLPYKIPYWTARKITSEMEYHAPIMLTVGILVFPIFYCVMGYAFYTLVSKDLLMISLYMILLPVSGFYCIHYLDFVDRVRDFVKLNSFFKKTDLKMSELITLKEDLTLILDEAMETYLKRL